jgi:hypothetical protein
MCEKSSGGERKTVLLLDSAVFDAADALLGARWAALIDDILLVPALRLCGLPMLTSTAFCISTVLCASSNPESFDITLAN